MTIVVVNVCPAGVSNAPPDKLWDAIADIGRWREWTDAVVAGVEPPGRMVQRGQVVRLHAPRLRFLRFTIDIADIDPQRRWIDLVARFPFGIVNEEHVTLTETEQGGTLVRFN